MSAAELPRVHLPSVDRVLAWPVVAALIAAHGRPLVVDAVRAELAALRAQSATQGDDAIAQGISTRVLADATPSLRKVFNLTGTVLHTNLGRAPLPPEAIEAMVQVASGASNLEYDLAIGQRGDRDDHVEQWLCRLTGAQAATVVNNNAAAVLLLLNTLSLRKETIVSRGELIEIGGAFRLPDIMARAGCKLREVGTTNRTHLRDYEEALGPRTALMLKAHTSNYRIEGFVAAPDERALSQLAKEKSLPFVVDLGSGTLIDLARFGLPHEPTPAETLSNGADLVTFSGDKLLGGPQAGIIVGRADLIARIKKNPMKRAMRCDKVTIAALAAVLRLYGDPERLVQRLPALRLLARSPLDIEALAHRMRPVVGAWLHGRAEVDVVPVHSQIGSGSLPVDVLPSFALRILPNRPGRASGRAVEQIAAAFRDLAVPVIGRIADGAFLLDMRCLEEEELFVAGFAEMAAP
ncbi:L-seryl-tRNA(Sec) selenium transferase [Noviherbaspirillum sp.]|uniref:L-seryl-tRNA(Sec) selenium transferase n=1 Tax=Noviherbaspirillum sp. TaxID=1926288 RepID=UPI002B48F9F8|nr:L-seryl-tRNA(Sec) selenium transferase [Noviherbaspirillum sp.]HJV79561.1 L-seryl-tRNA(Sec) selenium transferase [Noviherbaspirillum sp.]